MRKKTSKKTTKRSAKKKTQKRAKTKTRAKKRSSEKRPKRKPKSTLYRLTKLGLLLTFILAIGLFGWAELRIQYFLHYGKDHGTALTILGTSGPVHEGKLTPLELFSTIGNPSKGTERREPVVLHEIPEHVPAAILAVEDRRFYSHFGIDLRAIGRALYQNVTQGRVAQGASTITQQLAKNLFLTADRTLLRKVLEVPLALVMEWHLSKDEILELYLNEVYLGQEGRTALHGVGAAAHSFFRKQAAELTTWDAALLAGIIRAPSAYSPRRHPERARKRRNIALDLLAESGQISVQNSRRFKGEPLDLHPPLFSRRLAPFFGIELEKSLDHFLDGSALSAKEPRVITGLSPEMQECAERAVSNGMQVLERDFPFLKKSSKSPLEIGFVALEPISGLIRAWVGGRDYSKNQFDHVALAKRQIGSTIKPFIYLTALDPNLNSYRTGNLRTILPDKPVSVKLPNGTVWTPNNADRRYRGRVTFRYALEQSLNLPPVHVLQRVGIPAVQRTIRNFGLHPNPPPVLSLSLGALDTDLLSLTAAYGALANDGMYVAPRLFDRVESSTGKVLFRHPYQSREVAQPGAVFLVSDVLRGVIKRGTAQRAKLNLKGVAPSGKTGTSQDQRDAWFVGYTPRLVAGVWIGFDNNKPTKLSGGRAAAPIWKQFMECASPYVEFPAPIRPRSVHVATVDQDTGGRATENCPRSAVVQEFYLRGTAPEEPCSEHRGMISSDDQDNLRPNNGEQRDERKKRRSFWDRILGTDDDTGGY